MSVLSRKASRSRSSGAGWRAAAHRAVESVKAFGVSLTRRKAVQDLSRLDERMLADMGLSRSDLTAVEYSLWSDPTERLATIAQARRAARAETLAENRLLGRRDRRF